MSANEHHIIKQFDVELRILKDKLLLMASVVEDLLASAMRALRERDPAVAEQVAQGDRQVNVLEMEVDELCVRILALRQPAASDLRFIAASLKICTDLERVGDLAVNIAERAEAIAHESPLAAGADLQRMAQGAQDMLRDALDAFVRGDADQAEEVLERDQAIDDQYVETFHSLADQMRAEPESVERALSLVFIAKHLERVADHATNIAEMVVYLVRGQDVRHKFSVEERNRRG